MTTHLARSTKSRRNRVKPGRHKNSTRRGSTAAGSLLLTFAAAASLLSASPAAADTWSNGHLIHGDIEGEYLSIGAGNVGYAVTDELDAAGGRFQVFERPAPLMGNSIYWSSSTGAHQVGGVIRDKWRDWGWETGTLGYPLTRETSTPSKPGAFNTFQGGSIYWSAATGANEIGGLIRDKWAGLGWENGALGFPASDEFTAGGGSGKGNHFEGGSVYWSPSTGAHAVWGDIRNQWSARGWENGDLGYPTSDEYDYQGGKRQDFEHGWLTWNAGQSNYNRQAAVAYADQWANSLNYSYPSTFANDCTNYVSQALLAGGIQQRPGGLTASPTDPTLWYVKDTTLPGQQLKSFIWSNTWSVAPNLKDFLLNTTSGGAPLGTLVRTVTSVADKSQLILDNAMQPGDVMFYDWTNDGVIDHAAMYVGKDVTNTPAGTSALSSVEDSHSNNRYHKFWSMKDGNSTWINTKVYLVHINDSAH